MPFVEDAPLIIYHNVVWNQVINIFVYSIFKMPKVPLKAASIRANCYMELKLNCHVQGRPTLLLTTARDMNMSL